MEQIDTLAVSGGGAKLVAALGTLNYLEEKGILKNIKKYAGTSAGAIVSTLLVMNYSPKEIKDTVFSKNSTLVKESYFKVVFNILRSYGIYSGDKTYSYFESLFEAKGFSKSITFKQLYDKTDKTLTIVGTSLSEQDTFYFNHHTQPDMKVIDALRISISIPIYFTCVEYTFNSKVHILVDGGLLENFPLHYYNVCNLTKSWIFKSSELKQQTKELITIMKKKLQYTNTIGILIRECDKVTKCLKNVNTFHEINTISEYFTSLLSSMLGKIEESNYHNPVTGTKDNFFNETIIIKLPIKVSSVDFDLSESNKNILITAGYESAEEFFQS